jgi:hypothetical protein
MNKGNLNKLVTNYPVQLTNEEVENLSLTLSAVRTAGGGGGEGKTYHGEGFVSVNNTNNSISLTTEANEKLNQPIPTKVSDLSDSANYQTVAGMDEYLTTANAQTLYQTKEAMSDYAQKTEIPDSITDFADTSSVIYSYINPLTGDIQQQLNGKQNKLQFDLNAKGEISAIGTLNGTTTALVGANVITGDYYSASNPSGFINSTQAETQILEKNYITSGVSELDNFYSKTDTSSRIELQTKFDSLLDYNVTAAAGIQVTTATDAGIKTFGISMTAEPVVTDTRLSGYNGVAAALDTNVSGLWNVGLTHDMLNTINGKLDTTVAAETYQPTGYYATSAGLTDGNKYAMTTNGWEVVQGGTSFTGVVTGTGLSGTGLSNSPLGIDTGAAINFTNGSAKSATSAYKAASASAAKRLQDSTEGPIIQVGDVTALQNWASSNSSTWDGVSAKSTVSANTATNVISISANSTATTANISATTYYTNTADSNLVAQRLFVVHNDADLIAHVTAGLCQEQGSLFFVMSGFNS